jgi:nicotinic acid phosphoribosyltransferase
MTDFTPVAALFRTDAYNLDNVRQHNLGGKTTRLYCNYTNRRSRIPGIDHVVHFGLQAYLQQLTDAYEPFFNHPSTGEVMRLYKKRVGQVLGTAAAEDIGADHIGNLHGLGYLPLRFCGLREGTLVPIGVPSFTFENTHDDFAWLSNYHEADLSSNYWPASTVATIAHEYRKILLAAAERTGADLAAVDYQGHDFSYRGMSSPAAAGAAHLLSFKGTDSLVSLDWIDRYYGGPYEAKSIPATKHSVMSLGIATVGELETYRRLLKLYPTGNVAIVSDTFDLWKVITEILPTLKDEIMARAGKLIIRPDSGDPEEILLGDAEADPLTAPWHGVVRLLHNIFGGASNAKGFTELDPHIGDLYGDSITLDRAASITNNLADNAYVSTAAGLGIGSFSYQYQTRDTFGSAAKATWAEVDGRGINVFKDPVTDDGTKKSATGRLAVLPSRNQPGELFLLQDAEWHAEKSSLLKPVWENGKFVRPQTFEDVRRVLNTVPKYWA